MPISRFCLAVLIPLLSALPACQLVTKASGGTTPVQTSSGSSDPAEPAPDNGAANRAIELVGSTIPEATRLAKVAGFEGSIKVDELSEYDASCQPNTVCRVTPLNWRAERVITLSMNKTTTISVAD